MLTGELVRLLGMSASALVAVIAFGLSVQPLAEGLIGVGEAVRFAALLTVPMLQFAMPFAGGFAATLVYHRFAGDGESVACSASGIPHRATVVPALALGALIGAGMFGLSAEVIPRFLRSAESMVAEDVASLVITPLRLGRSVRVGDLDIRAGEVVSLGADEARGAAQHLAMFDVFAARVSPDGRATMFVSAERVDLWVFEERWSPVSSADGAAVVTTGEGLVGDRTAVAVLQFAFTNATGRMPDGALAGETLVLNPIRVPTTLSDNVKYLTWRGMDRALEQPRRLNNVDRRARWLVSALAERAAGEGMRDALALDGVVRLDRFEGSWLEVGGFALGGALGGALGEPVPGGLTLRWVSGGGDGEGAGGSAGFGGSRWELAAEAGAGVGLGVRWIEDGRVVRVQRASWGGIELSARDPRTGEPRGFVDARLELRGVRTVGGGLVGGGEGAGAVVDGVAVGGERELVRVGGLRLGTDPSEAMMREPAESLLRRAEAAVAVDGDGPGGGAIARAGMALRDRIAEFEREVVSKRHEQVAFSVGSCVMVLLGAVMALRLSGSLPLAAYLWSFLPALATVVLISTGERLAFRHGGAGLWVLWSGVVALAVLSVVQLRRVGRH